MNTYQFNPSDYAAHTIHLSAQEDLCYRRLLDLYYQHEKPLPFDGDPEPYIGMSPDQLVTVLLPNGYQTVTKWLRFGRKKVTVLRVLAEFFVLQNDGWHNKRADLAIEKYRKMVEGGKRGGEVSKREKNKGGGSQPKPKPKPKPKSSNSLSQDSEINALIDPDKNNEQSQLDAKLAFAISQKILTLFPHEPDPNFTTATASIESMRTVDGLTHRQIVEAFKFVMADDFWSTRINTIQKLRKNFPTIAAQAARPASQSAASAKQLTPSGKLKATEQTIINMQGFIDEKNHRG